jgi:hypothetical protein
MVNALLTPSDCFHLALSRERAQSAPLVLNTFHPLLCGCKDFRKGRPMIRVILIDNGRKSIPIWTLKGGKIVPNKGARK